MPENKKIDKETVNKLLSHNDERDVMNKKIASSIAKNIELNKNSLHNGQRMLEDFVNGEIDLNDVFKIFVKGFEHTTHIVHERLELIKQLQSYLQTSEDIDKMTDDILNDDKGDGEDVKTD